MSETHCAACTSPAPPGAAFCAVCGAPLGEPGERPGDPVLATLQRALASSHDILRLLGRGGMGSVYLARERALDRLVAIKVLHPEGTDPEAVERFRREARTAARLSHPNIVPLHSFGEAEGLMYFVMGFVQGESLGARLEREGRLDPEETRRILADLAEALHYAHERGVVHRDVKPDNILLDDETGRPMLADFGVARSRMSGGTLTELGTALGTPHYMSPEQAVGDREIDGRSDLYSLGVLGYRMVAGRCPFEGGTARAVLTQHLVRDPQPLNAVVPSVPDDLANVVAQLLAKDPDHRFPDGRAAARALGSTDEGRDWVPEDAEESVRILRLIPWLVGGSLYVGYGAAIFGYWTVPAGAAVVAALAALMPVGIRRPVRAKYGWRRILSWAWRKPGWWSFWWPRWLRGRDDLWDRLPERVRQFRVAFLSAMTVYVLVIPPFLRAGLGDPSVFWLDLMVLLLLLAMTPVVVLFFWTLLRLNRWGLRAGLTRREFERLIWKGDRDAIWKRPNVEKLLLPKTQGMVIGAPQAPRTPRQQVRALEEAVRLLAGPAREIAGDAASAARDVLRAVEALDVQITGLARDADPEEQSELEGKLSALGEQEAGPGTEAQRRRRHLLEEQLELSRSLAAQLRAAQERRAHLGEVLRAMALQIASLEAAHRQEGAEAPELTGRIRAITEDARRYLDAYRELG